MEGVRALADADGHVAGLVVDGTGEQLGDRLVVLDDEHHAKRTYFPQRSGDAALAVPPRGRFTRPLPSWRPSESQDVNVRSTRVGPRAPADGPLTRPQRPPAARPRAGARARRGGRGRRASPVASASSPRQARLRSSLPRAARPPEARGARRRRAL